jgi:hypothetical protein
MKLATVSLKYAVIFVAVTVCVSGLISWFFNVSFWICCGAVAVSLIVNGLIAEVEDKDL